jgi:hypothetical protein
MQTVVVECKFCRKPHAIEVPTEGFERWKRGEGYIQNLMPKVSRADREMLISGTCDACFRKMFPPEEG